jgi:hypothetical protein
LLTTLSSGTWADNRLAGKSKYDAPKIVVKYKYCNSYRKRVVSPGLP